MTLSLVGCEPGTADDGTPSPRASAPATATPTDSAALPAPSSTALATIYVPLPGGTASAAIDARWPREGFVAAPSRVAGFEVFRSNAVTVSVKRYTVEPVAHQRSIAAPPCPSLAAVQNRPGVEVMSRGGGEGGSSVQDASWMVWRERDKLGVIATSSRGNVEYGTDESCCLSGNERDAAAVRATLDQRAAKAAVEACLAALATP